MLWQPIIKYKSFVFYINTSYANGQTRIMFMCITSLQEKIKRRSTSHIRLGKFRSSSTSYGDRRQWLIFLIFPEFLGFNLT